MTILEPPFDCLLPQPRRVRQLAGAPLQVRHLRIEDRVNDTRLRRALEQCASEIRDHGAGASGTEKLRLVVAVDSSGELHEDGYQLTISPESIQLVGGSASGCFYGIETLRQLLEHVSGILPCCRIEDWPDYRMRGLLFDITRGKVPTLATLKRIVDRLAKLKVNHLQLNIEHAFVFSFDPGICSPPNGITPDEVRELDAYCRDRFIELVPAVATLGHMGRILSMPRYRHLAEVETDKTWGDMGWPERLRGLTLDCANPEAHRLVERICGDIMDAFPSSLINCCGDEPHDLGKGKNRDRFDGDACGRAYVDQLRRVQDFCASRGRRVMFWGDVLKAYPHLLRRLATDVTLLHWGYDASADYAKTAEFVAAGITCVVCPGTSGWKRILNAMDRAERNISTFAEVGKRHGAVGLLNTDWGDHGHFNQLACSWHGIAIGACKAWRAGHLTGHQFDACFTRHFWHSDDARSVALLRDASKIAERCETWRLLWQPLRQAMNDPQLPSLDDIEKMSVAAHEAQAFFQAHCRDESRTDADFAELALACRFAELFAEKIRLAHAARMGGQTFSETKPQRMEWAQRIRQAGDEFAKLWSLRNKHSGLDDIMRALVTAGDDMVMGVR